MFLISIDPTMRNAKKYEKKDADLSPGENRKPTVKQEKNEKNKKEKKEKEKKEKGRSKHGKGKSEKPEEGEPQAPKRARKSKWILLSYVGTDCLRAIAFCVGTPNGISWGNLQATCHEIGTG